MSVIISASHLSKIYGQKPTETVALADVSLAIKAGEFVAIIGPSGSGKSTLMHILGCLDVPTSGKYSFEGQLVSSLAQNELAKIRNKKIGFIFQSFNLLPRTSSVKNVELPLIYAGIKKAERREKAIKVLKDVGLSGRLEFTPAQLSGGEQQRVAIARALVNNPLVFFADEPTGNLDSKSSAEIMGVFKDLNRKGHTIVMITHEMDIARNASRIIKILDGRVTADGRIKK